MKMTFNTLNNIAMETWLITYYFINNLLFDQRLFIAMTLVNCFDVRMRFPKIFTLVVDCHKMCRVCAPRCVLLCISFHWSYVFMSNIINIYIIYTSELPAWNFINDQRCTPPGITGAWLRAPETPLEQHGYKVFRLP